MREIAGNQPLSKIFMTTEDSDLDLVTRIKGGDASAVMELHARYCSMFRSILQKMTLSAEDADDIISILLVDEILNRIERFDPAKGKFLGWLITILRRKAIDNLRSRKSREQAHGRFNVECELQTQSSTTPAEEVAQKESRALVHKILNDESIPEKQRICLHLSLISRMSQRQIAQHLKTPLGTVKTRIELGKRKFYSLILARKALFGR